MKNKIRIPVTNITQQFFELSIQQFFVVIWQMWLAGGMIQTHDLNYYVHLFVNAEFYIQ